MITAGREEFARAVKAVLEGVPSAPPQPVYSGILLQAGDGRMNLTSCDGDVRFTASLDAQGEADIIIPGNLITAIAPQLTGDVVGIEVNGSARVSAGRSRYELTVTGGRDYPAWAKGPAAGVSVTGLGEALAKVTPAASGTHPVMRSVLLCLDQGRLALVCTNDACMAVTWLDTRGEADLPEALVAAKVMSRIGRALGEDVSLGWDEKMAVFSSAGLDIAARQVSGRFRTWKRLIREEDWLILDKKEMITAIRNVSTVSPPDGSISVRFADGKAEVSARGPLGHAQEEAGINYEGPEVTYLLGTKMLLAGLAGCAEMARAAFSVPPAPLILAAEDYRWYQQPRREV